ncbi:toll-like receptor 10 [Platysternon megacephalum]|uniref:Toll-like receptor 10 n=1 Tax=Platysternon megacephalum TaxID=55544 RepID=A0A4D9EWL4_9SAUR|nr:toll-like receptor 10 [Platysternon megacephalum]
MPWSSVIAAASSSLTSPVLTPPLPLHRKMQLQGFSPLLTNPKCIPPLWGSLHWLPFTHHIQFKLLILASNALHNSSMVFILAHFSGSPLSPLLHQGCQHHHSLHFLGPRSLSSMWPLTHEATSQSVCATPPTPSSLPPNPSQRLTMVTKIKVRMKTTYPYACPLL